MDTLAQMLMMQYPNSNWGTRLDKSAKGNGWLGQIPMPVDPETMYPSRMTELSADATIGGKETAFPLLVPTLSKDEVLHLRLGGEPTESIYEKAIAFAKKQMLSGMSPFKE